jgi:PAS domain S-box-containing protein
LDPGKRVAMKNSAGMVSGGIVIFHDFTQGRNALQSFVLLSRVVEQTAESVVLTDTQGIVPYVNPAFEATTGYSRDEALGKTPRFLRSGLHDAEFYRQMWAQFAHGLAFKAMVINRKKTGELFWAQQTITSIPDESRHLTHFVSVSQDITELRKKQEQEFQLQLARAMFSSASMPPHPWYRASTLAVRRIPPTKPEETILISSSWRMVRF